MGLFDRWFKDSNYIDIGTLNKQYQQTNKSFRSGRADQRIDPAFIEVNMSDPKGDGTDEQRSKINHEYFLRQKETLRYYSSDLLVQAIIRTRTNQILQYAMPVRFSNDGDGFRVIKKDKKAGDMTKAEQKKAKELEDFIYHTGKKDLDWRDDFPTFLTKILYDFYVYDQVNIERVYESKTSKKLNHFNHVDAGTILIDKFPRSVDKPKTYVQVVNRKEVAEFKPKELTFITYWSQVYNEKSGYGFSPVEAGKSHIQDHINAEQFNAQFFSHGGLTRGLLLIDPGDGAGTTRVSLDALRRNLTPAQGINGSWKIPIIQAHDAKYVNMTQSSKDMEFVNFLNYLNNIICADFQIQPDEVNFPNRGGATGTGNGTTLNEGNTTRTKMNASRQVGLAPVLKFLERVVNDKILKYVDDKYRFVFTPSEQDAVKRQAEEIQAKELAGMTLNEGRSLLGLKPIDGGDVPGNANNYIQYLNTVAKNDPETNVQQQHKNDYKNDQQAPAPKGNVSQSDEQQPQDQDQQDDIHSDQNDQDSEK